MASTADAPRRNLSLKLRRGRKDTDRNDSTSSIGSGPMDDHVSGLKPSIDNVFAKVKERRARKSQDLRRNSDDSSKGLRGLLPSSKKSRRKSSTQDSDLLSASSDLIPDRQRGTSPNPSELSLGNHGSGHSSLLTEDSDDQAPVRPTLSPHQSHAGYLTLSSPLINAAATNNPLPEDIPHLADTLASPASPEKDAASLSLPATADRRQSPVDRFKGAFTLPKKKPLPEIPTEAHEAFPDLDSEPININTTVSSPRPSTPQSLPQKPTIITTVPSTPPNTVEPPTTFVTPPTPTSPQTHFSNASAQSLNSAVNSPPSYVNAAAQRRKRTGTFTSSKLSSTITASPLTPHIEEAKTPGGTITAPNTSSGFFSSVFNAAQNAANQLSTSLNTSIASNQKNKPPQSEQIDAAGGEEVIPGPETINSPELEPGVKRQLAVETLGRGDLSLDQLGISTESSDVSPMTSNVDLQDASSNVSQSTTNGQKQEESAAQRAVSAAYEKPVEKTISQATGGRPLSMVSGDGSDAGFQTPPRTSGTFDSVKRAGSVRSKLSGRRRHRGSSAATGGTLAAAVSASSATLVPGALGQGHRSTGFAVASSKRNKDFHQLFRSVPEDDYLIEDYSAALQRDILLHGRLYVSEGHICFSSNILGWVTNLVISFDEVVSVEKKSTAVIFPNAIVIQTLHARNVFASLVARDSTYDLIISIWKISHPNLKSSLHGVALDDSGTGDKTERAESIASEHDSSDQATEDDVYDEDEDQDDMGSFYEPGGSVAGSEIGDQAVSRKTSAVPVTAGVSTGNGPTKGAEVIEAAAPGATASADFSGPATHAPTECGDDGSHYDRPLADTTIPAPLGKVYSLMWGPASGTFMKKWLVDDQKSRELSFENEKGGMDDTHRTFIYSYIKPLNAPVGPRQTKCIVTATMETFDLEKCVSVNCSTATPDVPSGGIFTTKTRYCMMWGPNNSTRLIANCTVEWTGKSWLKGPIEKGANDGQTQYVKDLVAALTAGVAAKATVRGAPRGKGKGRRRTDAGMPAESVAVAPKKVPEEANWGLFEPLRGPLEPFVSILQPLFSAQIVITILVLLLAWTWLFPSRPRSTGVGFAIDSPGRLAAYEELWRREESELWDWLEDRVGLSNGIPVGGAAQERNDRQKALGVNQMGRRLRNHNLEGNQVEDAIRVTEERLSTLKDAVQRKKAAQKEEKKQK
ncbi:hypothetical protein D6C84_04647 [Aureobasidium pullulans]|uniref:VASt domain-containing protein n=1 Tax=Aureobasidium pullulans TaxID=5580 RepID=A0A4S9XUB0_AURPU|nr:hypothetical protein D6C84_04647 [Aureobasidium pullulans]